MRWIRISSPGESGGRALRCAASGTALRPSPSQWMGTLIRRSPGFTSAGSSTWTSPPATTIAALASSVSALRRVRVNVAGVSSSASTPAMRRRAQASASGASGVTVTSVSEASAPAGNCSVPCAPLAVKAMLPPALPMVALTGSPTGGGAASPSDPPPHPATTPSRTASSSSAPAARARGKTALTPFCCARRRRRAADRPPAASNCRARGQHGHSGHRRAARRRR